MTPAESGTLPALSASVFIQADTWGCSAHIHEEGSTVRCRGTWQEVGTWQQLHLALWPGLGVCVFQREVALPRPLMLRRALTSTYY